MSYYVISKKPVGYCLSAYLTVLHCVSTVTVMENSKQHDFLMTIHLSIIATRCEEAVTAYAHGKFENQDLANARWSRGLSLEMVRILTSVSLFHSHSDYHDFQTKAEQILGKIAMVKASRGYLESLVIPPVLLALESATDFTQDRSIDIRSVASQSFTEATPQTILERALMSFDDIPRYMVPENKILSVIRRYLLMDQWWMYHEDAMPPIVPRWWMISEQPPIMVLS